MTIDSKTAQSQSRIIDNRMAQLGQYWKKGWDIIPLYSIINKKKFVRQGKEPYGKNWQKYQWIETEIVKILYNNPKFNVGIRHCSPDHSKMKTIGIDFDGRKRMIYTWIIEKLRLIPDCSWRNNVLDVFEHTALMQSSPEHTHLIVSIDSSIKKQFIKGFGEQIEILGVGNQSVIPPSRCSKGKIYTNFQRHWIDNRDRILHLSNEDLEKFIIWGKSLDPNQTTPKRTHDKKKNKIGKSRVKQTRNNYRPFKYLGYNTITGELKEKWIDTVLRLKLFDGCGAGERTYFNEIRALIYQLIDLQVPHNQINEIVLKIADDVNSLKTPDEWLAIIDDLVHKACFHSRTQLAKLIGGN
ncbi:MAG: bifunctional DNA primase/polymerase [Promethearchaeota archaeon]